MMCALKPMGKRGCFGRHGCYHLLQAMAMLGWCLMCRLTSFSRRSIHLSFLRLPQPAEAHDTMISRLGSQNRNGEPAVLLGGPALFSSPARHVKRAMK